APSMAGQRARTAQRGTASRVAVRRAHRSRCAGPAAGRARGPRDVRRRARPRHDRGGAGTQQRRARAGGGGARPVAPGAVPAPRPLRHPARLMRILRVLPLAIRMVALVLLGVLATAALTALLARWLPPWQAAAIAALVAGTVMGL